MSQDVYSRSRRRKESTWRQKGRAIGNKSLALEALEQRHVLSAATDWVLLADSNADAPPVAVSAVVPISGDDTTDGASMLAAGGPGDPNLPGWSNVGIASDNNTTCVYLGGSWCITANHVSVSGPVHFGGQLYDVEAGSVHQLHNSDNSLADLKVFRIINPPDLPNILPEYLAPAEPSGQVYMVGDGYTLGAAHYWQVDTGVSPWTWTEQSPPVFPGADDAAGFSVTTHRTLRWGQNTIDQTGLLVQVTGSSYVQGFTTRLDTLKYTGTVAQPHEAQATNGDSGGAVFAYINGHWVLSGIMNAINQPLSGQPSGTTIYGDFTLISDLYKYRDEILSIVTPSVVGRHLFYNNSVFDGIDAAIGPADDAAIAPDKAAYLPGTGTSTFASISSYVRGINGIMVDIAAPTGSLTASDFTFKIGTSTSPETWANAAGALASGGAPGAGAGGSDRVEITWNDNIKNEWLQVIVEGNDAIGGFNTNTGLAASDVFYFGSRIGDSGSGSPVAEVTNVADEIGARLNYDFGLSIDNIYDFDRNSQVNSADEIVARLSYGYLLKLDLPAATAVPSAVPAAADAVSTALAGQPAQVRVDESARSGVDGLLLNYSHADLIKLAGAQQRAWQQLAADGALEALLAGDESVLEPLDALIASFHGRLLPPRLA